MFTGFKVAGVISLLSIKREMPEAVGVVLSWKNSLNGAQLANRYTLDATCIFDAEQGLYGARSLCRLPDGRSEDDPTMRLGYGHR